MTKWTWLNIMIVAKQKTRSHRHRPNRDGPRGHQCHGNLRRNPLRMLLTMLPAYMTALGTSSSSATIPVTLRQAKKLGVKEDIADFCIPRCAAIHLAGSTFKITATALAICMMNTMTHNFALFADFIFLLGVMMVGAPGVPGGAIMAAIGVLQSVLGFGEAQITPDDCPLHCHRRPHRIDACQITW